MAAKSSFGHNRETSIPFSARLFKLLNRPRFAKYQNDSGDYGYAREITRADFDSHIRGECTIALSCVNVAKTKFLAIDIDQNFDERLAIFADSLRSRGLDSAAFGVTGSEAGRGKIVITLQQPLPQTQAVRLVQDIVNDGLGSPAFGPYKAKDISTYPTGGDGSHVRILGKNLKRARHRGICEMPLDLAGNISDLFYVEPAAIEPAAVCFADGTRTSLSAWATSFVSSAYSGNTEDLFRLQLRLASEAAKLYGDAATDRLTKWFHRIDMQSARLSASARRQLTRPDLPKRLLEYVRAQHSAIGTLSYPGYIWCPKKTQGASRPAIRVYEALTEFVRERHLDPHCFEMAYSTIASLTGYCDKARARRAVVAAEAAGLLVRLDLGVPIKGRRMCVLYALVCNEETPEAARTIGTTHKKYHDRIAARKRLSGATTETALRTAA